jgi:phosphatidylserine/phosphatidylglycerophosphate/cardiolipin synthase-like enzyme
LPTGRPNPSRLDPHELGRCRRSWRETKSALSPTYMITLITENGGKQHLHTFRRLLQSTKQNIKIASAYVTDYDLIRHSRVSDIRLLTSLSRMDVISGATSPEALLLLTESGVVCKCMPGSPRFHVKVYIFDNDSCVVTSANLTHNALYSNIETGVLFTGAK